MNRTFTHSSTCRIHALTATALLSLVALSGCQQSVKNPVTSVPVVKVQPPKIAVALGGGGAKGFAHIGVLKVLESHGIKPDIVTGTSAGSFVGSIYASGKSPQQLQKLALTLKESDITDLTLSNQGFVKGIKLRNYVNKQVNNRPIEQFPIKFAAVATELSEGKKTAFTKGNAGQAVQASASIPNLFIPTRINGKRYVDGGLTSPIPVSTAAALGADIIIAVDISAKPQGNKPLSLWSMLDQSLKVMSLGEIHQELAGADVVIRPAVGHVGTLDLTQRHETILAGESAAQAQLPQIKAKIKAYYQQQRAAQTQTVH